MASPLIDTHCHLDSEGFHQEIDLVIQRAQENGLERMISIGTTLETSQAAILLSIRGSPLRLAFIPSMFRKPSRPTGLKSKNWFDILMS